MSTVNTPPSPSSQQPQYVEEPGVYVFSISLNQNAPGNAFNKVAVPIDRDADFLLTGINGSSTGPYQINMYLPSGRQMASSSMQDANFVSPDPQQPTAIGPPPLYRAGSNGPQLDLINQYAGTNTIEIEFSGIRRLRTA